MTLKSQGDETENVCPILLTQALALQEADGAAEPFETAEKMRDEMIVKTHSRPHNPAAMQKTPGRSAAFTLIELLVVIAIIAVLIGLLFPAFKAVQNQAKQTQAKNDLTQIVNAVNAYYAEYGKYPLATADTLYGPGGAATNNLLFNELRSASATQNPRQIVFINPPYVKNDTAGQRRSGVSPTDSQYYDPWGRPYNIKIDGGYDNQLTNPYSANTGAGPGALASGVIAWSGGKDGIAPPDAGATTTFSDSDDVISWQ
ncbi:MAG TPA: prepilin-type N-terminal cleavage/methylation domain-containing protein [Candidatus Udaeobacter sp.]|nr:prepilin-type N-terminal cleavage/methylation domain-containing protein [Candidatus Udaeobacter sp.]